MHACFLSRKKKIALCYQSNQDGTDWAGAALVICPLKTKQQQQQKTLRLNRYAALNRLTQIGGNYEAMSVLKKHLHTNI